MRSIDKYKELIVKEKERREKGWAVYFKEIGRWLMPCKKKKKKKKPKKGINGKY